MAKEKKKDGHWIEKMHMKKGALKKQIGPITEKKLNKAAKKGGKLGKRARLAKTLMSFNK